MSFRVGLKEYDNCEVLCIIFVREIWTRRHYNMIISFKDYYLIAQDQTKGLLWAFIQRWIAVTYI